MDRWLPVNYELPDGSVVKGVVEGAYDWQIYDTGDFSRSIITNKSLAGRWEDEGLTDNILLANFKFGDNEYYSIASGYKKALASVENAASPETKDDALAFVISLHESRKLSEDAPFHDAIYIEKYSRLLPTWSVSEKVEDSFVLGGWLTGGVSVSINSKRRLTSLMGWLGKDDVLDIIQASKTSEPSDQISRSSSSTHEEPQSTDNTEAKEKIDDQEIEADEVDYFSLPGRLYLESFFNEHVVDIINNSARYKALGIEFPTAIILHGPPGCGKTYAVERLVEYLDWPIFHVESGSVGSPYIHETSKKISEVFEKAIDSSPAAIMIDEMETYLSDRQMSQSSGMHRVEETAEFLRKIPEASSNHVLVIGMTNHLEMIDPAILRRGRFDHIIEVSMPSEAEVTELVTSLLAKLPTPKDLNLDNLITQLSGRPLSDAAFVIHQAARLAGKYRSVIIEQNCIDQAVLKLPPIESENNNRPIGFV